MQGPEVEAQKRSKSSFVWRQIILFRTVIRFQQGSNLVFHTFHNHFNKDVKRCIYICSRLLR